MVVFDKGTLSLEDSNSNSRLLILVGGEGLEASQLDGGEERVHYLMLVVLK